MLSIGRSVPSHREAGTNCFYFLKHLPWCTLPFPDGERSQLGSHSALNSPLLWHHRQPVSKTSNYKVFLTGNGQICSAQDVLHREGHVRAVLSPALCCPIPLAPEGQIHAGCVTAQHQLSPSLEAVPGISTPALIHGPEMQGAQWKTSIAVLMQFGKSCLFSTVSTLLSQQKSIFCCLN